VDRGAAGDSRGRRCDGGAASRPRRICRALRLEHLLRCWENPARYFLQARLGISLPGREERLADREPLTLDPSCAGGWATPWWKRCWGADLEASVRLRQGLLPLGTPERWLSQACSRSPARSPTWRGRCDPAQRTLALDIRFWTAASI
jgi:hypothetical protein